jgi:hypothetical protein
MLLPQRIECGDDLSPDRVLDLRVLDVDRLAASSAIIARRRQYGSGGSIVATTISSSSR